MFTDEQKRIVYPQYAQIVTEWTHWVWVAQYLFDSAERLEPEISRLWRHMRESIFQPMGEMTDPGPFEPFHLQRVYLMLIAFCLENVFKGYIIKTQRKELLEEAKQAGDLPRRLKTHDLQALAKMCPLRLNSEESRILHRLADHATWIGRYPYPTRADQFYFFSEGSDVPGNGVGWSSDEIEVTKQLVEGIADQLEMPVRPQGGGPPT